jgi:hypothetical protein
MLLLPFQHRPGTDLLTKALFQTEYAKDIVIDAFGEKNTEYTNQNVEWKSGKRSDVVYSGSSPPIIIEIQYDINLTFLHTLTKYALGAFD